MGKLGWAVLFGFAVFVAALSSFAAGAWIARRAAREEAASLAASSSPVRAAATDMRAVTVAKLLILSLRRRGAGVLAELPRASPEDERHIARVKDKVVEVDGEVRELRYEDGLFVGTIASPRTGLAYFVTPIAVEGIAERRGRRFRGVPVAIGEDDAPAVVVVGAFDEAP